MRRSGRRRGGDRGSFRGRRGSSNLLSLGTFRLIDGARGGSIRGGRPGRRGSRGRDGRTSNRGDGGEKQVIVEPYRHPGVFIARSNDSDMLVTRNMVIGESVYGEERISVVGENQETIEYRVWDSFRSKLSATIICGIDKIHMSPGTKVLYLGAGNGQTVSHVSDIVGPEGVVYAVEVSQQSGRDLINLAKKRPNIIPIIEDAHEPHKYQRLVGTVDTLFADIAQPDQARIVALNAHHFMKNGGNFVITINARCIDSTAASETVFANEIEKLRNEKLQPQEEITLEPYEHDHAVVIGAVQYDSFPPLN